MTTPTAGGALAINFGAITGQETATLTPADTALTAVASSGQLLKLSCRSVLDDGQRAQVRAIAEQQFSVMLRDRTRLSTFGVSSLDGVNACVSNILRQQTKMEIPEIDQFTREMTDAVNGFQRKYDPTDPKVKELFEKIGKFIRGIFTAGRRLLEDLYHDTQTVEKRLDGVAGRLVERAIQLRTNVALCDELYRQNEAAIVQLVGVIAVMEEVRDLALAHAGKIETELRGMTKGTPQHRDKEEELSNVREFLGEIEIRINEFIQRLFVAWSTSPQVRNIRKISLGLATRLDLLVQLTIPTLKLTIASWGMLLQAQQAGKVTDGVADINNRALTMFAGAAATAVPLIEATVQQPSTRPETIMAVAQSIIAQNEGLELAVREGQRRRAVVVDAVVRAGNAMSQSGAQLNATAVALVRDAQQPLELPAAPDVPAEVLEHAPAA